MASGIYKITNTATGSCYIGSAVDIRARWRSHKSALNTHRKAPPKLQRAWDKYGERVFEFTVLLLCAPENLLVYEQACIDAFSPRYNTRKTAESNLGVTWSAETNRKKHDRHRVHTVRGVMGCVKDLAAHFGVVSYGCATSRIRRGASVEEAVLAPKVSKQEIGRRAARTHATRGTHPRGKLFTAFGTTDYLKNLVHRYSTSEYETVRMRIRRGMTLEQALVYR